MEIPIANESTRFTSFLDQDKNKNIIFSAPFGTGKTFFLNSFFKNNPKYTAISISPVNYSVASNEDIFECLKVDILIELINKNLEFEKNDCSFELATQMYLMSHPGKLVENILRIASKVKLGVDCVTPIVKLKEKIDKYREKISVDEKSDIYSFIEKYAEKEGAIFEDNAIAQLIRSIIFDIKKDSKEIVLVIDDLDRMDPAHIFRILNVFSAHEDFYHTGKHKFAFDKILFVCDIENIRHIYSSKYGKEVDFKGYIDKFYSDEVFRFDNKKEISKVVSDILRTIKSSTDIGLDNDLYFSHRLCYSLLQSFLDSNSVNLRNLLKQENKYIRVSYNISFFKTEYPIAEFPCLVVFYFLEILFPTISDLENAINKLFYIDTVDNHTAKLYSSLFIVFADIANNKLNAGEYKYLNLQYKTFYVGYTVKAEILQSTDEFINPLPIFKQAYINYKNYRK